MALNSWRSNNSTDLLLLAFMLLLWLLSIMIWVGLSLILSYGLLYGIKIIADVYGGLSIELGNIGYVEIILGALFFALILKGFLGPDSGKNINELKDGIVNEIFNLHKTVEELKNEQIDSLRQIENYLSSIDANTDQR